MIWMLALAAGALVAAGVYLALAADRLRAVVGVSLVGAGANLVVLTSGQLGSAVPAFIDRATGVWAPDAANPLPQALALTAIVIAFALTCFSLVLVLAIRQREGAAHADEAAAEPAPRADGSPALLAIDETEPDDD